MSRVGDLCNRAGIAQTARDERTYRRASLFPRRVEGRRVRLADGGRSRSSAHAAGVAARRARLRRALGRQRRSERARIRLEGALREDGRHVHRHRRGRSVRTPRCVSDHERRVRVSAIGRSRERHRGGRRESDRGRRRGPHRGRRRERLLRALGVRRDAQARGRSHQDGRELVSFVAQCSVARRGRGGPGGAERARRPPGAPRRRQRPRLPTPGRPHSRRSVRRGPGLLLERALPRSARLRAPPRRSGRCAAVRWRARLCSPSTRRS